VPAPDKSDRLKHGQYLVNLAACMDCHTQIERGDLKMDLAFAGGREFRIGKFLVNTANITPDPETGIGEWSEERFVKKFRDYANFAGGATAIPAATQANFTLMPWPRLSQMPEEDLKAIYAYLRTLKPIRNPVVKHPEQPAS
jgi:mono/diheme cytochrome c family protein